MAMQEVSIEAVSNFHAASEDEVLEQSGSGSEDETLDGEDTKRKVNGYIGFRAYYSAAFEGLPQKARSMVLGDAWKTDLFHNEWNFICAVFSAARSQFKKEGVDLQRWIDLTIKHVGIIDRVSYIKIFQCTVDEKADGTYGLKRGFSPLIEKCLRPMDGLELFHKCLLNGLHVENYRAIAAKFTEPHEKISLVLERPTATSHNPRGRMDEFAPWARQNPAAAMELLTPLSEEEARRVQYHEVQDIRNIPLDTLMHQFNNPKALRLYDFTTHSQDLVPANGPHFNMSAFAEENDDKDGAPWIVLSSPQHLDKFHGKARIGGDTKEDLPPAPRYKVGDSWWSPYIENH